MRPIICRSLLTIGSQTTMLYDLAPISADSTRRGGEAARLAEVEGGYGEWLAGRFTVGYQGDNNVWRRAGAMYVLQKNNCFPFNSNFLIGLAVVEENLERRQVRERLRERIGCKTEEKEKEDLRLLPGHLIRRYQLLSAP